MASDAEVERKSIPGDVTGVWPSVWLSTLLVALAYLLAAQVSLSFILKPENIAPFWLASGVSLAALALSPRRHWPYLLGGIFLVNLFGNLYRDYSYSAAAGFAVANVVEPWLGAWLIRRSINGAVTFRRLGNSIIWIITAVIAAACGALIGAGVGMFTGGADFWPLLKLWWIDDLIGILSLGSLIVAASSFGGHRLADILQRRAVWMMSFWLLVLASVSVVVFSQEILSSAGYFAGSAYLVFPVMLWLAIRFDPIAVTLGGLMLTVIAVWGTVLGLGPFVVPDSSPAQQVLALQVFLSVTMISSLLMASLTAERDQFIQELHQTQDNLEALNAGLEQRVDSRTSELKALNEELEAFSYSVSHDLRAPLRRIDGFAELLKEEGVDRLDPECVGYVQRIQAGTKNMSQLIEGLLQLSRVSQRSMQRVPVDLANLVCEIVAELRADQPDQAVEFVINETGIVNGDAGLLRSLLDNLVGNAWKYASSSTNPHIEFGQEHQAGKAVFYVKDNGIGFDMKHADKLFTPFQRLHDNDEFAGSGIGLATVQRIAHRHGGRVWAESNPGKGSIFRFTVAD